MAATKKEPKVPPPREFWSSRVAFYSAAAGAAIGFGNVWRFPGLMVQYGGGSFFIPYLIALFVVGLPLSVLEIGFGQYFQTGDIGVFGGFHPRLRGVGVASLACAFIVGSYYIVLIAWVIKAFFASFDPDTPWAQPELTGEEAITYFQQEIIGMKTLTTSDLTPTRIVSANVGYTFLVWVIIFATTAFGLRVTGRITYVTMGLPFVILFIFLGRAIALPGSQEGVDAFIGLWDLSVLRTERKVWSEACSQVFFSNSLTFGLLTSYGSHCKRNEPVFQNACVVVALNSVYSIITGFAVFSALGHLAYLENVSVLDLQYAGFNLVFGTWPVVLGTLPGGIHWVRLLFFNLFLLGIDSAFAFVESGVTVLQDTVIFRNVPRRTLLIGYIVPSFLFGIIYCTDAGLIFLDVIDFYINFIMLLVGFLEAFGAAWACGMLDQYKIVGPKPIIAYLLTNFVPVAMAIGLWSGQDRFAGWTGLVGAIGSWIVGLLVTHYLLMKRMSRQPGRWTKKSIWYECAFGNISRLRDQIQPVIGNIPFIWVILIKNLVPHTCIVLFFNLLTSPDGAGSFSGYAIRPYQLLGLLCFIFAIFLFFVGLLVPEVYAPLALPQTKVVLSGVTEFQEKEETADIESSSEKGSTSLRDQEEGDEDV